MQRWSRRMVEPVAEAERLPTRELGGEVVEAVRGRRSCRAAPEWPGPSWRLVPEALDLESELGQFIGASSNLSQSGSSTRRLWYQQHLRCDGSVAVARRMRSSTSLSCAACCRLITSPSSPRRRYRFPRLCRAPLRGGSWAQARWRPRPRGAGAPSNICLFVTPRESGGPLPRKGKSGYSRFRGNDD